MKIQTKLYDLYSDLIKDNFTSDVSGHWARETGKKSSMASCAFHFYGRSEVVRGQDIAFFSPIKNKWFVTRKDFKTYTEVSLYELGLSDFEFFETPEEAFEYAKELDASGPRI